MDKSNRFHGPSRIPLATVHILLFAAGLATAAALRHGASYVTPFASADQIRLFFSQTPMAARLSSFFLVGSAVPLGIFAVTMVNRLRYLGVRAAGTDIALFGGLTASIALFLSGIAAWILSVPEVTTSAAVVKAIDFFNFLCGGVFFAVGFGLMVAGVSVTSYFTRLLPRWLVALGMILAITGELSWFSLVSYPANFLIPITRFVGFLWMILAAVAMMKERTSIPAASAPNFH